MRTFLKISGMAGIILSMQGCAWVLHTTSCVATLTVIC